MHTVIMITVPKPWLVHRGPIYFGMLLKLYIIVQMMLRKIRMFSVKTVLIETCVLHTVLRHGTVHVIA